MTPMNTRSVSLPLRWAELVRADCEGIKCAGNDGVSLQLAVIMDFQLSKKASGCLAEKNKGEVSAGGGRCGLGKEKEK